MNLRDTILIDIVTDNIQSIFDLPTTTNRTVDKLISFVKDKLVLTADRCSPVEKSNSEKYAKQL